MSTAPILVVDDDDSVRRLTVLMLAQGGYAAIEAADGPSALIRLQQEEVLLLLTDLNMPDMSGIDLARQALVLLPNLRILFYTGYSRDVVEAGALKPGRVAVLEKPFTLGQLLAHVRDILS